MDLRPTRIKLEKFFRYGTCSKNLPPYPPFQRGELIGITFKVPL